MQWGWVDLGVKFQHLGQLLHKGTVLQSEVILLAVQLPLKHLILAEQSLHLL